LIDLLISFSQTAFFVPDFGLIYMALITDKSDIYKFIREFGDGILQKFQGEIGKMQNYE
jgi:hypothetical protein